MFKLKSWLRSELFIVSLLILLSLSLKLFRLDELLTFTYDQGRDLYVLQGITRGDLTLVGPTTGLQGVFLGPFMYYFLLPGYILGNGSPLVVAQWSLLVITLTSAIFYFLLKRRTSRLLATVGLLLLVLTPGAFEEARQIWNPSLVVPVLLASTYCLFKSKTNHWWLIPALFLYGLSLQTELAYTVFLAPLFGLWILTHAQIVGPWWQKTWQSITRTKAPLLKSAQLYPWRTIFLAAAAFGLTLLPQLAFELRNDFIITTSFMRESSDPTKKVALSEVWAVRPAQMLTEIHHRLTGGTPGLEFLSWLVIGCAVFLVIKSRDDETLYWVGWFALPLIGMLFHTGNSGHFFGYYITAHYLPALALVVLSLAQIRQPKLRTGAALAAGLFWIIMYGNYALKAYDTSLYQYSIAHQTQALLRARELQVTERMAIDVMVPNMLPINYQYLSEWLSRSEQTTPVDFGITDHQEYVLLSEPPDSSHAITYDPWIKKWTEAADCSQPETFGILTLRHCLRAVQPSSSL